MEEQNKDKKLGTIIGITLASILVIGATFAFVNQEEIKEAIPFIKEDTEEWHIEAIIHSTDALGDNDPGVTKTGWIATFLLDYAETPATCLASNGTGVAGYYDTWGNVSGFVDTDNTGSDITSEDPFYFVVRCRFNDTVKNGSAFAPERCRVTLIVTGDETISSPRHIGNNTNTSGGGIISTNGTSEPYIWIDFFWDDNSDGYRILDDGSLAWSIVIEARY